MEEEQQQRAAPDSDELVSDAEVNSVVASFYEKKIDFKSIP